MGILLVSSLLMEDVSNRNRHKSWWRDDTYSYQKRDMISLKKIRPRTIIKKMNCSHDSTTLTWKSYKKIVNNIKDKTPVWYTVDAKEWYLKQMLVCPICQASIPYEEVVKKSLLTR